ncbi:MAG: RHS repeat protein [Blastochloris sp.]|nr:RHS repeat protein [Blastochloris sp.]
MRQPVKLVESFNDGHGNLSIKVEATDDIGISSVVLEKTSGPGTVTTPTMVPWPSSGPNIYVGTIRDVPPNAQITWRATATDTSNQKATVDQTGRVTFSSAFGSWCPATCLAGNPVNTATGNDTDTNIDLAIPGPGDSAIIIDRNYNSQDERDGPFGRGTSFMYDMQLTVHDNLLLQGVQVRYPDGHTANFRQNGAGFDPVSPGNFDRVERSGSNYILRLKDRSSFIFDVNGRLIETRTRNDVPIKLFYNSAGKLERIEDQTTRGIKLTWVGNHITQIDAPENKTLRYTYSGARLTSFTDGRNGLPTTFQHDGADRITAVITPNGYPRLRQELDERGRVKWQLLAHESASISATTMPPERPRS